MSAPQTHRPPLHAYACLALSMTLVGSYVALSKPLVAAIPVFLLAWLRFGIGSLAMWRWLRRPPDEVPMTPRVKRLLFLESLLGNFLFSLCMLAGVSLTSALAAGVVLSALPAAVAVLSWLFLRERMSLRVALAVLCAALGIGLIGLGASGDHAQAASTPWQAWLGNGLVLAAVLCEAAYAVIGKSLSSVLSPKRISAIINLWGFALMTPLGIFAAWSFDFGTVPLGLWLLLVFYGLAASVWSVWLWMTGLRHVPASEGGVFTVMLPVAAAAVGVGVLGEPMTTLHLMAFGLALVGVLLATIPTRRG